MGWLRKKGMRSLLVAVLVASLLPLVAAPTAWARGHVSVSYATWLRAQLRLPADAAFDAAVEEALDVHPRSLDDFLQAFVAAYEAQGADLADVFSSHGLSGEALVAYLQGRYLRLIGQALVPRVLLTASSARTGGTSGGAFLASQLASRFLALPSDGAARSVLQEADPVFSFRLVSSARPLGP